MQRLFVSLPSPFTQLIVVKKVFILNDALELQDEQLLKVLNYSGSKQDFKDIVHINEAQVDKLSSA